MFGAYKQQVSQIVMWKVFSVQCTECIKALGKSVYFAILVSNISIQSAYFLQKRILIKYATVGNPGFVGAAEKTIYHFKP